MWSKFGKSSAFSRSIQIASVLFGRLVVVVTGRTVAVTEKTGVLAGISVLLPFFEAPFLGDAGWAGIRFSGRQRSRPVGS